jgi:hypothetical protein
MKERERSIILPKEGAELRQRRAASISTFLGSLDVERAWEVIVKPFRQTRSGAQNRALWGLAYKILSEHTGHETEELHEYFLGEFSGWEIKNIFGQKKRVPKMRSHRMDTITFNDFFAFIQRRAAETVGVYIPDPDPNWWLKDERKAA